MSFKEIRVGKELALRFYPSDNGWMCGITPEMMEALEQAEKQEPVAWQWLDTGTFRKSLPASAEPGAWRALYTAPPQRQPLNAKEIAATVLDHCYGPGAVTDDMIDRAARAIERKHGIGSGE